METNGAQEHFAEASDASAEDIARLAYSLWQARGETPGRAEEDWYEAEELLRRGTLRFQSIAAGE